MGQGLSLKFCLGPFGSKGLLAARPICPQARLYVVSAWVKYFVTPTFPVPLNWAGPKSDMNVVLRFTKGNQPEYGLGPGFQMHNAIDLPDLELWGLRRSPINRFYAYHESFLDSRKRRRRKFINIFKEKLFCWGKNLMVRQRYFCHKSFHLIW